MPDSRKDNASKTPQVGLNEPMERRTFLKVAIGTLGAIYAGAAEDQYALLSCYGEHMGLAFQIVDDLLDVEESSAALGKTAGKDAQQHKITFPAVYGLERSHRMAEEHCALAHQALTPFGGRAARLDELADHIVQRKS